MDSHLTVTERNLMYRIRLVSFALMAASLLFIAQENRAAEPKLDNVPPKGFVNLFNGKDLTGWTEGGKVPEHWTVKEGMLVFDGKGRDLFTAEKFSNYVLLIDWRVEKNGNSGVYLRGGNPQVEINDADSPKGKIWVGTTGGLYPDLPPTKRAAKATGEWNHFEITVANGSITVLTNGEKTVAGFKKNWGDRSSGSIGFQNHGTPLWFKNIYVKKLED
jgi:hypothetical protein